MEIQKNMVNFNKLSQTIVATHGDYSLTREQIELIMKYLK